VEIAASFVQLVRDVSRHLGDAYAWAASLAAWLVVGSLYAGARPSELLARAAGALGPDRVADWWASGLPPLLDPGSVVGGAARAVVVGLLALMIVRPLWLGLPDAEGVAFEGAREAEGRAGSTTWLALVIVVQTATTTSSAAGWVQRTAWLGLGLCAAAAVVLAVVRTVLRRVRRSDGSVLAGALVGVVGGLVLPLLLPARALAVLVARRSAVDRPAEPLPSGAVTPGSV